MEKCMILLKLAPPCLLGMGKEHHVFNMVIFMNTYIHMSTIMPSRRPVIKQDSYTL